MVSLQLEIYEACRSLHGDDDILTLNAQDKLAMSLCHKGRFKEASDYQEKVVDGYKNVCGAEDLNTLRACTNSWENR